MDNQVPVEAWEVVEVLIAVFNSGAGCVYERDENWATVVLFGQIIRIRRSLVELGGGGWSISEFERESLMEALENVPCAEPGAAKERLMIEGLKRLAICPMLRDG